MDQQMTGQRNNEEQDGADDGGNEDDAFSSALRPVDIAFTAKNSGQTGTLSLNENQDDDDNCQDNLDDRESFGNPSGHKIYRPTVSRWLLSVNRLVRSRALQILLNRGGAFLAEQFLQITR